MNPKQNAKREGHEATLQYRTHQETLGVEERYEERLAQLHSYIRQLKRTPPGAVEFERRIKVFGECNRVDNEPTNQFYGRLRHWLDRDMPLAKARLHPPRHSGD